MVVDKPGFAQPAGPLRPVHRPVPHGLTDIPLDKVSNSADFGACLTKLRNLAGINSNREVEKFSNQLLGRTKVGKALAGELPKKNFLVLYLLTCGVPEEDHEPWLDVWSRLDPVTSAFGVDSTSTTAARDEAREILAKARAEAAAIVADAHAEADGGPRRLADLRAELEEQRETSNRLVREAGERQEAAQLRFNELAEQYEMSYEAQLRRIKQVEDERDVAIRRSAEQVAEIERLHQSSLQRIQEIERDRDNAQLRAREMENETELMQRKLFELRDQLSSSTKALAGEIGTELKKMNGELGDLRKQIVNIGASTMQLSEPGRADAGGRQWDNNYRNAFNDEGQVTPPVIGL